MKEIKISCNETKKMINGTTKGKPRTSVNITEPECTNQTNIINSYYLQNDNNIITKELKKKICGYKTQDEKKNIYDNNLLITLDEVVEKLVSSKLKCYYCMDNVKILYSTIRDQKQWTLDRIDNNVCHSCDNTVICCLQCNLQRRIRDSEKFVFTKQLKLKKLDY